MRTIPSIALIGLGLLLPISSPPASAAVAFSISVDFAPPPLPVYVQPPIPEPGYIWIPGYWDYAPDFGYYWVPGTWVLPPEPGLLWTPAWWGFSDGVYLFHPGYWGPAVGFYGGIDYGFGYFGTGFVGGRWDHGRFFYNRAFNNFGGVRVVNVYHENIRHPRESHISFNGGRGGIQTRPTERQIAYERERHVAPTSQQARHREIARSDPDLRASANHARPPVAATERPGDFRGRGVAPAQGAISHEAVPPRREPDAAPRAVPQPERRAEPQRMAPPQQPDRGMNPHAEARPQPEQRSAPPRVMGRQEYDHGTGPRAEAQPQPEQRSAPQMGPERAERGRPEGRPAPQAAEQHSGPDENQGGRSHRR